MAADEEHHRASDAEREAVADRLRAATAEGRLDPDELDERLTAAYAARTRADLVPLTSDLPVAPPAPEPVEPVWRRKHMRSRLAGFITTNVVMIAIWAATGAGGSFWPKWILLATGIGFFGSVVRAVLDPEDEEEREALREQHRAHHRERHRGRGLPGPPDPPRL